MSHIIMPFVIAALLAYLGDPWVNYLSTIRIYQKNLPRQWSAGLVLFCLLLLILLFVILLIPLLETQISMVINKIPVMLDFIQNVLIPWLKKNFDITIDAHTLPQLKALLLDNWRQAGHVADKILFTLSRSSLLVLHVLINLILIPIVTFYLLRDWPVLLENMKNMIPRQYLTIMTDLAQQCNEVLSAFFRGQFLVMLALGLIYTVGLLLIKLEFALLLGIMIAILSIVPYLGTLLGLILAIGATVFQFHSLQPVLYTVILFAIGHLLESMVLTPWLIGNQVGLHPVMVIFAILAGGSLFGFFGVLLAIPVAAVLMVLLKYLYTLYKNTAFYQK